MTKKILPPGYPDVIRTEDGECLKRTDATLQSPEEVEVLKGHENCEDCETCSSTCLGQGEVFWASVVDARQELVDRVLFWASYQKLPQLFPGKAYDGSTCPEGALARLCAIDTKLRQSIPAYLTPEDDFNSCCKECYYLWYNGQQIATLLLDTVPITNVDYCTWQSSQAVFGSWRLYTINGVWVLEDTTPGGAYHGQNIIGGAGISPPPCPPSNIEFYKTSEDLYANITITTGYGSTVGTYSYTSQGLYPKTDGSKIIFENGVWKLYDSVPLLVATSTGTDINNPLDGTWTATSIFTLPAPVLEVPTGIDLSDQIADIKLVPCDACSCFDVDGATVVDVNGFYESVAAPAAPSPVGCVECSPYITISGAGRAGADGTYALTTDNSTLPLAPGQIACEYENTVSGWKLTKEFGIGKYELFDAFGTRVYTSTDGGATWPSVFVDPVDEPAPGPMSCYDEPPVPPLCRAQNTTGAGATIDFYPTGHALGDNVYVISVPGFGVIYTSTDGGATWVAESGSFGDGPSTFRPVPCQPESSGPESSSTTTEAAICYVCTSSSSESSRLESSSSLSDSTEPCEPCIRVSGSGPLLGLPIGTPDTADGDYFPIDPGPFRNAICVYQQPSSGFYIKQFFSNDTETWVITTDTGKPLYISFDGGATFSALDAEYGTPPVLEECTSSSFEPSGVSDQPLIGVRYVRCVSDVTPPP
jgi:hypothetical protein